MTRRSVEDRLRQEYFELLPEVRRVLDHVETQSRHCLLKVALELRKPQQLDVKARVKECESAIDSLRRKIPDIKDFDQSDPDRYTLTSLPDLAAVRVLVFPSSLLNRVANELRQYFGDWPEDLQWRNREKISMEAMQISDYTPGSARVKAELQVVPMLIGRFWEVEHSAIYKASPDFKDAQGALVLRQRARDVELALKAFDAAFERAASANIDALK